MEAFMLFTETVDTYGSFILGFVCVGAMIFYRNTLLDPFRVEVTTFKKRDARVSNTTKLLSSVTNTYRSFRFGFSDIARKFIYKFKK